MKRLIDIFTSTGCLSEKGLAAYNACMLNEEELSAAKAHIASCDLCEAAVEGMHEITSPVSYMEEMEQLRKDYSAKRRLPGGKLRALSVWFAIAASFLILLGVSLLLVNRPVRQSLPLLAEGSTSYDINRLISEHQIPVKEPVDRQLISETTEETKRKDFDSETGDEMTTPVAQLTSTVVRPRKEVSSESSEIEPLNEVLSRRAGTLRYPFRVMSHAPANLHLSMPEEKEVREEIFFRIEDMPRFEGQDHTAFQEFIRSKLVYPHAAKERGISGTVYVQFTVNKHGDISGTRVIRGIHPLLNDEVKRVIALSPRWEPGRQRGHAVDVSLIVPVEFVLY